MSIQNLVSINSFLVLWVMVVFKEFGCKCIWKSACILQSTNNIVSRLEHSCPKLAKYNFVGKRSSYKYLILFVPLNVKVGEVTQTETAPVPLITTPVHHKTSIHHQKPVHSMRKDPYTTQTSVHQTLKNPNTTFHTSVHHIVKPSRQSSPYSRLYRRLNIK